FSYFCFFVLFGCGNQNNVENADEINGNIVHDQNGNGTNNQEEESKEIIVYHTKNIITLYY
ncbi:MAG: hypothetical protein J6S49_09355, partial [Erysipelotrichaceae bacterium]|nr:hypothetical protein [Erysipelotrichaceae bacterium]